MRCYIDRLPCAKTVANSLRGELQCGSLRSNTLDPRPFCAYGVHTDSSLLRWRGLVGEEYTVLVQVCQRSLSASQVGSTLGIQGIFHWARAIMAGLEEGILGI